MKKLGSFIPFKVGLLRLPRVTLDLVRLWAQLGPQASTWGHSVHLPGHLGPFGMTLDLNIKIKNLDLDDIVF